jgi:CubicO group peptidase (beta-lactamase class C family)
VSAPAHDALSVHGRCDPRFTGLRDAFAENFRERGEIGAALAVTVEGTPVVDLWAGYADPGRTRPWRADTLVDVFSVGKPMAALCMLILAERGELDLDAPVALHWPEFAAAGKDAVSARVILAHRAGLPALRGELAAGAMYDWGLMTSALAAETPWWEPGTLHGYHVNTYGFLVGEIVRRISGRSVGRFFADEVARRLGADFHFGLAAADHARCADFLFPQVSGMDTTQMPEMTALAYLSPPGITGDGTVNTAAWRSAELPSANGHGTARAVARIYSALAAGGSIDGVRLLDPGTVALAATEASSGPDAVLGRPSRFGLGFQLTQPERPLGPSPNAFGHFGAGGSLGFADPDAGLAFGYTPNQGLGPRWQNPRNRALLDALYASL